MPASASISLIIGCRRYLHNGHLIGVNWFNTLPSNGRCLYSERSTDKFTTWASFDPTWGFTLETYISISFNTSTCKEFFIWHTKGLMAEFHWHCISQFSHFFSHISQCCYEWMCRNWVYTWACSNIRLFGKLLKQWNIASMKTLTMIIILQISVFAICNPRSAIPDKSAIWPYRNGDLDWRLG